MPYNEQYRSVPPLRAPNTGPLAWEDPSLPWFKRWFVTLSAAFMPLRTVHAVADGPLTPALTFCLVSSFPFMLLWAITPFTHTLMFNPEFALERIDSSVPMAVDVVRAMGIGLGISVVTLLSWTLPFMSLVSAFANGSRTEQPRMAAWRLALYLTWVTPLGMTLFSLATWGMPRDPNPVVVDITIISTQILPRILIMIQCHTMARYFGANGFGALVVSGVPLAVQWAVGLSVQQGAELLLPHMPQG